MKRILVVINGNIFPHHVVSNAINIARSSPAVLHPVFMNALLEEVAYDYSFPNDLPLTQNNLTGETWEEEANEFLQINSRLFQEMCTTASVLFIKEQARQINLKELIELSAFSDLILTDVSENTNQHHIIDLLTDTCCPVYLVSRHVERIKHVILTYDGSFSSIYAIKQYALVFPETKDLPTHLVHITPDEIVDEFPRQKNIKSWLPLHYSDVEFKILHGNVRNELVNFAKSIPDSLVVMGSFGRSALSRLFHKSLANAVIADGKSALFIAHK